MVCTVYFLEQKLFLMLYASGKLFLMLYASGGRDKDTDAVVIIITSGSLYHFCGGEKESDYSLTGMV